MNLRLMLEEAAGRWGDKQAIVLGDRRLSYADLDETSNKVANALLQMGVSKGDRVVMLLSNSPEFVVTFFGIVKIGAIAVPLDTKYKIGELSSLFHSSQPKVLLVESPTLEPLLPVLSKFNSIERVIDLNCSQHDRFVSYREIMAAGSAQRIAVRLEPGDTALIAYTSGPSFRPAGVMLSHQSMVREAVVAGDGFQQTDEDVSVLFALPLHHMLGLVGVLLAAIQKGGAMVIVPGTGLSIHNFTEAIEREKATMFVGIPYIYALAGYLAKNEGIRNDLSSLRLCVSAGSPLSLAVAQQFKRYYGQDIIDCWGLSETVCHVTCPPLDGSGKTGSIGKALPGWEVKIVDDNGKELPPNCPGEMIVRGPMMKGYYNDPQATAAVVKDGWLYTGDVGKADEDGNLFITGRKKNLVIIKAQNVHPGDVEAVLSAHPKVAEAVVIGIADELRGEIVGAVVTLKEGVAATEQELRQFCLERLVEYKVPRKVMFLDSLPRSATGEIDKTSIRLRLSIPSPFP